MGKHESNTRNALLVCLGTTMDAYLDNDGFICSIPLSTPSPQMIAAILVT